MFMCDKTSLSSKLFMFLYVLVEKGFVTDIFFSTITSGKNNSV